MANIVVQKFGGTSVSTDRLRQRAVKRVLGAKEKGFSPVVVVSAMGRAGDPYATDTLLGLMGDEGARAAPREADQMAACGEVISSVLFVRALAASGCPAVSLTGAQAGLFTDERFGNARITHLKTERLMELIHGGFVPVVAGFQGVTERGDVTTLGRGGSDTTAAALAVGLGAAAVEIYTDVAGIMSADPRLVPDADILPRLTYQEVSELAHMGVKVIHPRAVDIARQARVPVRVLGMSGEGQGTLIADEVSGDWHGRLPERVVTGIAHVGGRVQVQVEPGVSGEGVEETAFTLMRRLADEDVNLDMIFLSPEALLFVVDRRDYAATEAVMKELDIPYRIRKGLAKVSVVGATMYGVPGVMADVLGTLRETGVAVRQTADSQTTISCLVSEADVKKAVRALHRRFQLGCGQGAVAVSAEAAIGSNGFTGEAGDAS